TNNTFNLGTGAGILANFYAFNPGFQGGVQVAAGQVEGAFTFSDLAVAAGPGGNSQVTVFRGSKINNGTFNPTSGSSILANFYAYSSAFNGGLFITVRDFNYDGLSDVVIGTGPGVGPLVTVIDAQALTNGTLNLANNTGVIAYFYAFDPNFQGGVRVANA